MTSFFCLMERFFVLPCYKNLLYLTKILGTGEVDDETRR